MKTLYRILFLGLAVLIISGCITSPVMMNKMEIKARTNKLDQTVLLAVDEAFLSQKHQEKQLGTTFEYDLGFYLKNAIHDSLKSVFKVVAQSDSTAVNDKFDLVVKPTLVSFSAPVPALVLMSTKTEVTIQYEVVPKSPLKPFALTATGTYELLNDEDKLIYSNLTSGSIYTYDAATNFGMAVPDYSYEAGKDAYMAIYHTLTDLNAQLVAKLKG